MRRRSGADPFPPPGRTLRAIGFDDAPFRRGGTRTPRAPSPASRARRSGDVAIAGVVCAGTRFEGLVWGAIRQDGWNATDAIVGLLAGGKFLPQLHLVLLDGLGFGGLNLVDLEALAARLRRPCVAVMRRAPDIGAMEAAIRRLPRPARRLDLLRRAGPIHHAGPFWFQVHGAAPEATAAALARVTDRGAVPEALRLAHLVGAAVVTGESGRRA